MLAASTARQGGTPSGNGATASRGMANSSWCGCKRKDHAPGELGGPGFDLADDRVAVFHRERELAAHVRPAHARILALRHAAGEHQRLGAAADGAKMGTHAHVVRPRRDGLVTQLCHSRSDVPERLRHRVMS